MLAIGFDPYARQARLIWNHRFAQWRRQRAEFGFHLSALLAGGVMLATLVAAQRAAVAELAAWLWQHHAATAAVALLFGLGMDQRAQRRRALSRQRHDWLGAQPLSAALRRWRRSRDLLARALWQAALLLGLAGFAQLPLAAASMALALIPTAALLGHALPLRAPQRSSARETPFAAGGRASFWRWQWIEAGASLAPRRLAWALLAILLVPRGGWVMAGVALGLILLVAAGAAWQRGLAVIPAAQRWITTQPVLSKHWLRSCLPMPLILLGSITVLLVAGSLAMGSIALAGVFSLGLPSFGLLHLAVVASERHDPARIPWLLPLHAVLLASAIQSLPPLAPLLWGLQLLWLGRRSLRA